MGYGSLGFSIPSTSTEFSIHETLILPGHTNQVWECAWSPSGPLLASFSEASTAFIWTIVNGPCSSSVQDKIELKQGSVVSSLDWNKEGSLLAAGSLGIPVYIWRSDGEKQRELIGHPEAIHSIKWNMNGKYILGSGMDKAFVWDTERGNLMQSFEHHSAPILDLCWKNDDSFATCSDDKNIFLCRVGEDHPIRTFRGHKAEVNCIRWNATGSLLASCADDTFVKLWSPNQDKAVDTFRGHHEDVYSIRWSPSGPGTDNPNQVLLASASFDSKVKLWDVETGYPLHTFRRHRKEIYSIEFSPNGKYLASGSCDNSMHIWSVKEGRIVKTFTGNARILGVSWNKEGDKVAAAMCNQRVYVFDFRL